MVHVYKLIKDLEGQKPGLYHSEYGKMPSFSNGN